VENGNPTNLLWYGPEGREGNLPRLNLYTLFGILVDNTWGYFTSCRRWKMQAMSNKYVRAYLSIKTPIGNKRFIIPLHSFCLVLFQQKTTITWILLCNSLVYVVCSLTPVYGKTMQHGMIIV